MPYNSKMNIVVISASTRPNSQSLKIANYLNRRLLELNSVGQVLDLSLIKLPIYDDSDSGDWSGLVNSIKQQLDAADGYIFVSPEWNGMASVGLLNMLHYIDQELAHKPVMLVGVSATRGGSYPLQQLRTMGYKNRHYVILPESLLVTDCKNVFNDDNQESESSDLYMKKRAEYALKVLITYAESLKQVRNSGIIDFDTYPNGM